MSLHDSSYKHWDGVHRGIWTRRAVIAQNALRSCLQGRWMRNILVMCWVAALAQSTVLFLIGQLLVRDSVVVEWVANFNPELQSIARVFVSWLEDHPEISVRTTQNLLFYFFATNLLTFSLIAVALAMPHLITRDLSSNAIVVYSSKAVGRLDYLLGKFAAIFGLMALTWLGPVCAAWFLGNLLGPDWHFFWHARMALWKSLVYLMTTMTVVSILALGISAISAKEKAAVSLWVVFWLVGNAFIPIGHQTAPWLKHLSFTYNLDQVALAVFRLGDEMKTAQDNIPLLGNLFRGIRSATMQAWENPAMMGAAAGLLAMMIAAGAIVATKVRPD